MTKQGGIRMKAALFCHVEGSPSARDVQQELISQYILLERYARQHRLSIEYTAFHTGGFCLDPPDRVLSALLQQAQAKQFEVILVESKACFSHVPQSHLPSIQIVFVQEAHQLKTRSSAAPVLQQLSPLPTDTVVYWRQASAPCSTSSCNSVPTMS